MIASPVRAAWRSALVLALTLPLMPVQALALALGSKLARRLPQTYHKMCCRLFGLRVVTRGRISPTRPTLFVANHQSYFDICVLAATVETSFVAKSEVGQWPLFGSLARLQRTVFVTRKAAGVASERDEISARLNEGGNLVLFAEGTSGDGTRLLPFKSALFSVAERQVDGQPLTVQPVSVAYTRLDGMPIGRQWRPFFAWYGDMELMSHLFTAVGLGQITVEVAFYPPVSIATFGSRKALADHCRKTIAAGLSAAKSGRPLALPAPAAIPVAAAV
jgi:lyso-ornithine lipid O-acyltransferase